MYKDVYTTGLLLLLLFSCRSGEDINLEFRAKGITSVDSIYMPKRIKDKDISGPELNHQIILEESTKLVK